MSESISLASSLSYISEEEIPQAKEFIKQVFNSLDLDIDDLLRPAGYQVAIKIFVRESEMSAIQGDDGIERKIYLPETVTANDKFHSCTGLVVAMGPDCYKGDRFRDSGPWCRVGDFVVFPRNAGAQFNFHKGDPKYGVPMSLISDDKILAIVKDPSWVTRD